LAIGFLFSEGLIKGKGDIKKIIVDDQKGVVRVETEEDKEFSRDPGAHPGILGDIHPKCYDKACEERPELPWEDPISGEIDFQDMAAALGIWPGTEDDLWEEVF